MFGEEILFEIDDTLGKLARNAEALQDVERSSLSEVELEAFQKTQESLLHHLLHMDELFRTQKNRPLQLRGRKVEIQSKFRKLEKFRSWQKMAKSIKIPR